MLDYILVLLVLFFALTTGYLAYEKYTRKGKRSSSTDYLDALRNLLDGKQESAFTKLRQVVMEDSNNLDAYLRLGQILREHGRADRALQVHKDLTLRGGLSRDEKAGILHQLALDYLALDEVGTAETALRELIALAPQDRWAHATLLKLLEKAQKWDDAFDVAGQLLKLESSKSKKPLARYKYSAGLQLYKKREYHKARVMLKEAIGLDPGYELTYLTIGDSYYDEKRYEDAVNFWNKLIEAVPSQGHLVIERLKKTLFELGRFGDIIDICQNILAHDPKNLVARRSLAEFYEKKGETELAVEILEQIMDDYPDDLSTLVHLIRHHVDRGETRKLQDLLRMLEQKRETQRSLPTDRKADSKPVRI